MKARLAALAIPGGFLIASVASRLALAHAPARIARADLAQPVAVVTNWGAYGALHFVILFVSVGIAAIAYAWVAQRMWEGRENLSLSWIVTLAAAAIAVAWTLPAIFSSDVYAYAAYGEAARSGLNPYVRATLPGSDPLFAAAIWQWGNPLPVCVYGPVFVALAAGIVSILHTAGVTAQLDGLRALASLAWLACIALVYTAYPGERARRAAAAFFVGLNPVALWSVVEGHNDALALAAVLCGFAAMQRGRYAIGAAIAALAGTIKIPALAGGAAAAITERRARWGAAAGILAALALSLPLILAALTQLAPHGRYAPQASFEAIVKPLAFVALRSDTAATWTTWLVALTVAVVCARRGGWISLALAAWLLIPNPYPWYCLWLLPVAALAPGSRGATVAIWLSLASMLRYVPDAIGAPSPLYASFLGIAATLPFLALLGSK